MRRPLSNLTRTLPGPFSFDAEVMHSTQFLLLLKNRINEYIHYKIKFLIIFYKYKQLSFTIMSFLIPVYIKNLSISKYNLNFYFLNNNQSKLNNEN